MEAEKKIRIAYFIPIFQGIAMARWATNFSKNVDSKKYAISFIGAEIKESFKNEIPESVSVAIADNFYIPGVFFRLIGYLKKENPDILVSAAPHINTISVMAKIISGAKTKIVITEHNNFSLLVKNIRNPFRRFMGRFILPQFMRIFYPKADAVICVSKGVAEDLSKIIGHRDKIKVIYNPAISQGIYALSEEPVEHVWFSETKTPVILAAGRLVRQKDYPTLLRAVKLVLQKKSVRLVILGEGAEREGLQGLCQELGISENTAFLGFVKNQYKYMKKADVFILSSIHEGFGNVIVEAMACGTPVIATNCKSGPNEIINDGKNGILVPVGDYNALAQAIIKVLDSPSLRQAIISEGERRAECFSFKAGVKNYEKVFDEVIGRSQSI